MSTGGSAKKARAKGGQTRRQIIETAIDLIQAQGYCAFSYQDISDRLGLRKASIHYHFRSKSDLGEAAIKAYSERFEALLADALAAPDLATLDALDGYAAPYIAVTATGNRVCLCAALAGEITQMPVAMQQAVAAFFRAHQGWIAEILRRGVARGDIAFEGQAEDVARMIFDAFQGAVLVARTTHDQAQFQSTLAAVKAMLAR